MFDTGDAHALFLTQYMRRRWKFVWYRVINRAHLHRKTITTPIQYIRNWAYRAQAFFTFSNVKYIEKI